MIELRISIRPFGWVPTKYGLSVSTEIFSYADKFVKKYLWPLRSKRQHFLTKKCFCSQYNLREIRHWFKNFNLTFRLLDLLRILFHPNFSNWEISSRLSAHILFSSYLWWHSETFQPQFRLLAVPQCARPNFFPNWATAVNFNVYHAVNNTFSTSPKV